MDDWKERLFSVESIICVVQEDDVDTFVSGTVQMKLIKTKKASQFPKSFMIYGCMPFIGQRDMAVITLTINAHVYIEIPVDFLIPSIESWFGDDKVIFLG